MARTGLWNKYKIDGNRLVIDVKFCPICGTGYIMAEHNDRYTCGKCGYTEFKRRRPH